MHSTKKQLGFTLIELLVVIAIIGILATVSVVALNNARAKSRDAKRVADVKNIQTALALYYNDKGQYPITLTAGQPLFSTSLDGAGNVVTSTYISSIPSAPTPADGANCNTTNNTFTYSTSSDLQSYVLSTCVSSPPQTQSSSTGPAIYISDPAQTQPCGQYVINYEGKTYRTVQIGTQCWTRDNLNVGALTVEQDNGPCIDMGWGYAAPWDICQLDDTKIEKACKSNSEAQCDLYGGFYEWHEAYGLSAYYATNTYTFPSGNRRGICPPGWHMASDAEWNVLEVFVYGDTANYCTTGSSGGSTDRCMADGTHVIGVGDALAIPGGCGGRTPCGTSGFDWKHAGTWGMDLFWQSSGIRGSLYSSNLVGGFASGSGSGGWSNKVLNQHIRCLKD